MKKVMKLVRMLARMVSKPIAYRQGWLDGQLAGLHLQPEFTSRFLKSGRYNIERDCYEINRENYILLKEHLAELEGGE